MTDDALEGAVARGGRPVQRSMTALSPTSVAFALLLLVWAAASPVANFERVRDGLVGQGKAVTIGAVVQGGWWLERPVLPSPQQLMSEIWTSVTATSVTSRRNLLYHVWATLSASLVGLVTGTLLGALLAILLVEFRLFEAAALPWLVASQTVPTLAIAPIVVVLLGKLGLGALWQKAAIDALIVFFPVTLALVNGLRCAEPALFDLMRSYAAGRWETLYRIRLPAALTFLFPALKVAAAMSIVATIVAELPTGSDSGLGARLLVGSYNGLMLVMWSALIAASVTTALLIALMSVLERVVVGEVRRRP